MRGFRLALQFLTVLPFRVGGEVGSADLRGALLWFPLVGLGIGGVLGLLLRQSGACLPDRVAVLGVVAAGLLLTGALHLDGLADVADALCARKDREGRLAVMKDPRVGAAGAAAVVMALAFRWEILAALEPRLRLLGVLASPVVGRAAMVLALGCLRPARPGGLASTWGPPPVPALLSAVLALALLPPFLFGVWPGLRAAGAAALALFALLSVAGRAFGGLTGDVCGAAGELAELAFLAALLAS